MTDMLASWLSKRRERKRHNEFVRGFRWAMSEYFIEAQSLEEIQSFIDTARVTNTYNLFDAGAEYAIGLIRNYVSILKSDAGIEIIND